MATATPTPPPETYHTPQATGVWEHRGKVAAVGVGHAPTARRLGDPRDPQGDRGRRHLTEPDMKGRATWLHHRAMG